MYRYIPHLSLKSRISSSVLLLFIISYWLLAFVIDNSLEQDMRALLEAQEFSTASYIAADIDAKIRLRLDLISQNSKLVANHIDSPSEVREYLKSQFGLLELFQAGLVVIDKNGNGVADYPVVPNRQEASYAELEYFNDAITTGKTVIGKPRVGRFTKKPVVAIAAPIRNSLGEIIGVLVGFATLSDKTLFGQVEQVMTGKRGWVIVSSPHERIIVSSSIPENILQPLPTLGTSKMLDRFLAGYEGSDLAIAYNGVESLVSAKGVPSAGWVVHFGLPKEVAFAPIRDMQLRAFGLAAVLSVLTTLAIVFIIRRALIPLDKASSLIREMATGKENLHMLELAGDREIQDLLTNFNTLITQRKLAELKVLAAKSYAENLINTANAMFVELDVKGNVKKLNHAAEMITGYTLSELKDQNWFETIVPKVRFPEVREEFERLIAGKLIKHFENPILTKSGEERYIVWQNSEVREDDQIVGLVSFGIDITERKLSEIALKESEQRYQIIFDMTPLPMWIIDDNTLAFLMVNNFAVDHYGYSREEFSRMTLRDIRPTEDVTEFEQMISSTPNRRSVGEWRHKKKDGTIIDVIVKSVAMMFGNSPARIAIIQDITERKRFEKRLSVTASVFGISQEAITITDAHNNIIDVNPAFTRITGFSRDEVIGKNPNILNSGRQNRDFYENMWDALKNEGQWRGEIWNRRKSGEVYPEMLSISVLRDDAGKVLSHVAVFSDISNLKEHEAELVRVAHFDALTSIPNRILLADRMRQAISQTSRDNNLMAVCYLDLDGFKPINDTMGHQVGDDVLIEIARRIGNTIRGGDTVARLGGDEFVVLLLGLAKGEECVSTIERLLEAIAAPIAVKHKAISVTASIGVSIYPLDEEDPDTLLRHADQAMYVAKQTGKNRFHIFDVNLDKRARDQSDFLKSIHIALEQNQFELYYQPKVNLRTKELVGAEALIRWRHPERGLLSPAEFLRKVDNTDLDIHIGEWVTAKALAQMHLWRSMGLDIEVSINISGYHLESRDFVRKLQQQLANYPDLPYGKLQIEVLETVALNDVTVVQGIIESCRKIGIGFALDDFGTGYSSLSYLSALPVDTLKIDQSFVRDMIQDKGDMAIVQGIIALAKAFERQTVAEGVETDEQYKTLLAMGCEIGQGYGIARPMPANELISWKSSYH